MAVRTKEEIMQMIRDRTGENADDETLTFVEDISDTLEDLTGRAASSIDWEAKYNENDAEWRKRYKERFFSPEPEGGKSPDPDPEDTIDQEAPKTYEDLFTQETKEVK